MPQRGAVRMMPAMNSARTAPRLLLVADRRPGAGDATSSGVRRFRLVRLGVDRRPPADIVKRG
jgi:hypothetical protein